MTLSLKTFHKIYFLNKFNFLGLRILQYLCCLHYTRICRNYYKNRIFTLLEMENMVWIFRACSYSSSPLLWFETANLESRRAAQSQRCPCGSAPSVPAATVQYLEALSGDVNAASEQRCEARQPITIPCSSLPSSRIKRLFTFLKVTFLADKITYNKYSAKK